MNEKILKYTDLRLNFGRHIVEKFAKKINFKNVLDIGAGNGNDLLSIRKIRPDSELNAMENYPPSVKILSEMNVRCFPLDIEKNKFPFEEDSMDLIIGNQILEHTKETFWIFHEICRTLKNNGSLIIGVPNLASFHNRMLLLMGRQPSCIEPLSAHIRGFTKEGLERFAKIGGLKLIDFKGSNFYPFPSKIANFLSSIFPNYSVGIFFLFKKTRDYNNEYLDFPIKNKLATNYFLGNKKND